MFFCYLYWVYSAFSVSCLSAKQACFWEFWLTADWSNEGDCVLLFSHLSAGLPKLVHMVAVDSKRAGGQDPLCKFFSNVCLITFANFSLVKATHLANLDLKRWRKDCIIWWEETAKRKVIFVIYFIDSGCSRRTMRPRRRCSSSVSPGY